MALSVPIDTRDISVTPVFQHISVEDVPASEREKRLVMKHIEAVEVRFAGSKNYSPVFPVDAMWKREGLNVITYAERWPDQYRAFLQGAEQKAEGTPLEMLKGITPSQLSLCRVLKIYSIESLHSLEGQNLKNLGMHANQLKKLAADYMDEKSNNSDIAALKAEIERLKKAIPAKDSTADEIREAVTVAAVPDGVAKDHLFGMTDDELKDFISHKTGSGRPRGNPSRETLLSMAREVSAQ